MDFESKSRSSLQRVIVAVVCGCLAGAVTSQVEWISDVADNVIVGFVQKALMVLILPGMIASMFFSGNVHAFSLWTAAGVNTVVYFALAWSVYRLAERVFGRRNPLANQQ